MHPDIAVLPSRMFYESKLLNGEDLDEKCKAIWHEDPVLSPYKFFDVSKGKEMRREGGRSIYNPEEVEACLKLVTHICRSYPTENVRHLLD
jgi:senataxin